MGYIGAQPATNFETVRKQVSTTNSGTTITLDYSVSSVQDILVTVNAVVQSYDNYSVSGTTLTLGGTLNNDRVEILYVGRTFQTVTPAVGTVTNDMLSGSIANSKLANSSITLNGSAVSLGGSATTPSGSMVLVGSVSSTGSSSGIFVNGCFSSTYINYLFTYNIDFSSDGAKARVRFTNSSNTEQTSTYKQSSIRDSGSSSASSLYNSTNYFVLNDDGQSNFNNIPLTGHMYITDPNSSSRYTAFRNFASTSDSGRNSGYEISGGHYSENTSIAGLSIYPSGGNFEAWNFKVYGIVEA